MSDEKTLAQLLELGAATIHEAQGRRGALDAGIKPLDPAMRLAGPVYTVDSQPADNLMLHYALTRAQRGEIIVVDAKGFLESGIWGDILTCAAQLLGLGGIVVDGSVRDVDAIVQAGFPVFSRGVSIKGSGKCQVGAVGTVITCGGVSMAPGDYIVGDRDGLVVIKADELDRTLRLSVERERKEAEFRAMLKQGRTTFELLHLDRVLDENGAARI